MNSNLARYLGLGAMPIGGLAGGYAIGYGLDRLFHTHIFYLIFLLCGTVAGLVAMVREVTRDTDGGA